MHQFRNASFALALLALGGCASPPTTPEEAFASAAAPSTRQFEDVKAEIDQHYADLQKIFRKKLPEGRRGAHVVLWLTIAANGKVTHCSIKQSDVNIPRLHERIVDYVSDLKFGKADGGDFVTDFHLVYRE